MRVPPEIAAVWDAVDDEVIQKIKENTAQYLEEDDWLCVFLKNPRWCPIHKLYEHYYSVGHKIVVWPMVEYSLVRVYFMLEIQGSDPYFAKYDERMGEFVTADSLRAELGVN